MLYTIIQPLLEFFQLENIQGVQNRIVRVQALYSKRQRPLLLKCLLKKETILGL
jgi:hypothetical protein